MLCIVQKTSDDQQNDHPQEPCLDKTHHSADQHISKTQQWHSANDSAQQSAENMDDEHSGEKQHDIADERRNGDAIRGQEERKGLAKEDGYRQRDRNTEQVDDTKNRAVANAIEDKQRDSYK